MNIQWNKVNLRTKDKNLPEVGKRVVWATTENAPSRNCFSKFFDTLSSDMKYANQLTDEELKELYLIFTDSGAKINELNITKDECSIALEGCIEVHEWDEEILKEAFLRSLP